MCPGAVETEIFTVNRFVRGPGLQHEVDSAIKLKPQHIADGVWFMIDQPDDVHVKKNNKQNFLTNLFYTLQIATLIIRATKEVL